MAALDFPSTPADNEIFRAPNGATWKWDDTRGLWISVGGVAKRRVSRFTGIAGDDTLSVVYNVGQIDVYYNGVKLDPNTDFTATNGTSVVLTDAVADDSDIIETIAWSNFDITEGLDVTEGDARYSPITRSRNNLLINPQWMVNQRGGTTIAVPSAYSYVMDRWGMAGTSTSGGTVTLYRYPNAANPYLAITLSSLTAKTYLVQKIENVNTGNNKRLKLRIAFQGGDTGIYITPDLYQYMGTGGTPSANVSVPSNEGSQLCPTGSGTFLEWTFDLPSTDGKTLGTNNDHYLALYLNLTDSAGTGAPASGTQRINWVQLEIGNEVTDFEQRSYGEELTLCQRYFQTGYVTCYGYHTTAGGGIYETVGLPVQPRASATLTGTWAYYTNTSTGALTHVGAAQVRGNVQVIAAGVGNAGCSFTVDAEL